MKRIEEAPEGGKGQEEIEFEANIIENSNSVEQQVTSEQDTSSGENLIDKPSPEFGEQEPTSTVEPVCRFIFSFSCRSTITTKKGCALPR